MKVAVVGAGAVGGVLGGRLAASGNAVSLVARGAHLEAIRRNGLKLVDHVGDVSGTYRLAASDEPAEFGEQDLVIIALKAHAIAGMLPRLRPLLKDDTVVATACRGGTSFVSQARTRGGGCDRSIPMARCSRISTAVMSLAAWCMSPPKCGLPARCTIPAAVVSFSASPDTQ